MVVLEASIKNAQKTRVLLAILIQRKFPKINNQSFKKNSYPIN
jgi:hypothetical protein